MFNKLKSVVKLQGSEKNITTQMNYAEKDGCCWTVSKHMFPKCLTFVICISILSFFCGIVYCEEIIYEENFENNSLGDWCVAGDNTELKLDSTESHSGRYSAKIIELNTEIRGQVSTSYIAVQTDKIYTFEVWIKSDKDDSPASSQFFEVDLTLWDKDRKLIEKNPIYLIGKGIKEKKWRKVSGLFKVPSDVSYIIFRIQPTNDGPEVGTCLFDDIKIKKFNKVFDARREVMYKHKPVSNDDPKKVIGNYPPCLGKNITKDIPLIDFEDISGWEIIYPEGINPNFYRSEEEKLHGKYVGKLVYNNSNSDTSWIELIPPQPIVINKEFDSIEMWIYRKPLVETSFHTPFIVKLEVENKYGETIDIELSPIIWAFWSVSHKKINQIVEPPAKLLSIHISKIPTADEGIFYFDALTFYKQSTEKIDISLNKNLPFPTREDTILPTCLNKKFENKISKGDSEFILEYKDEKSNIKYVYTPISGNLSDIKLHIEGIVYEIFSGGGYIIEINKKEYLISDISMPELISCEIRGNKIYSKWNFVKDNTNIDIEYILSIKQKSLLLEVKSNSITISKVIFGKVKAENSIEGIDVPYLIYSWDWGDGSVSTSTDIPLVYLLDKKIFLSRFLDWYNSSASTFSPGGSCYNLKTNGERNSLQERIFITVSERFEEVLPNIPNPPSSVAKKFSDWIFMNLGTSFNDYNIQKYIMFLKECKRYGMDKLMVKHHTRTWSSKGATGGQQPWSQSDMAADDIHGGEIGLKKYIKEIKELGYKCGVYSEYVVSYNPINSNWNSDYVILNSDGDWENREGYAQCKVLTPLKSPDIALDCTDRIEKKFDPDLVYDDCMTSQAFWRRVDYDARKPYAGRLKEVFLSYGQVPLIEKKIYGGPVFSEGGWHWFFAGLFDGNYASLRTLYPRYKTPFLVDFDLLKIHPLETDLGMGYSPAHYDLPQEEEKMEWAMDRFLAGTIAFGHQGMLYGPYVPVPADQNNIIAIDNPMGKYKRILLRVYYLMQPLQSLYAMEEVSEIKYHKDGQFYSTSDAIKTNTYKENQVYVKYKNGLKVWVNGNLDEKNIWKISLEGKEYLLPIEGFLAYMPNKLLAYGVLINGNRVDFVNCDSFIYCDGRGNETDFGVLSTKGQIIIKKDIANKLEIIFATKDKVILDMNKLNIKDFSLVALDDIRETVKESKFDKKNNLIYLYPNREIVSYLLNVKD